MGRKELMSIAIVFGVIGLIACEFADNEGAAGAVGVSVASEYPAAPARGGGTEAKKFAIVDIVEYKALERYFEPDYVADLVKQGRLPPVERRLPEKPAVIKTAALSDGIGEYGGVFSNVFAAPIEGWNFAAGVSCGWFGIESIFSQSLTKSGMTFMRSDRVEPLPNLAKSWEWSPDGYSLTMNLVRGARWSDGTEFTADDVMFTWEDNILDPQVVTWTSRSTWQIDGKDIHLEKVDKYTVKWTFPVPFPVYKLWEMDEVQMHISPAHILRPLHPRYNPNTTYAAFRDAIGPTALPAVTMGPWVPVLYRVDEILVMRRNPYYWKVDERGRQLPYADEVQFSFASTGITRTINTLAGTSDMSNVENPETFDEVVQRSQQANAPFEIDWGPETLSFDLEVNQSATLGVNNDSVRALRELFRDVRFRRSLSHAIDREGIARSLTSGPFFRGFAGGIYPGSQVFDRSAVAYWDYDPAAARGLLAEMGLKDTDRDGFVNYNAGSLADRNVEIVIHAHQDQSGSSTISQALVPMFAEIGLKVVFKEVTSSVGDELVRTGDWAMRVNRSGQVWAVPHTRYTELAPITDFVPAWHRKGADPRQLRPFEQELIDIVTKFAAELNPTVQMSLMNRYQRVFTENAYNIGIVIGSYGLLTNANMKNVPVGCPAFYYQWSHDNMFMEALWFAPQHRRTEIMPRTLPAHSLK